MTQKVIKIGDSAAVVIPKKSLKELGIRPGDKVSVDIDKKQRRVSIEPVIKEVDKELISWTKKFIERYRPALEALAKK
ncbi:MAG: AbrB/MazE/SpoVT family DNA-binding domain-containing protein [Candidatus Zambryskibacteria bacterium]|nr:AbrB/MazE/SpoVT family DNA-binding domain-containing protein [Candidatus Zambryskibacteria bacterium]